MKNFIDASSEILKYHKKEPSVINNQFLNLDHKFNFLKMIYSLLIRLSALKIIFIIFIFMSLNIYKLIYQIAKNYLKWIFQLLYILMKIYTPFFL